MDWDCKLELLRYDPKSKKIKNVKINFLEIRYLQIKEEYEKINPDSLIKSIMEEQSKK